jgi:hypothetical protein
MNKFLSIIYNIIGVSNIFIKDETEYYKAKAYLNIDYIDYFLNNLITKYYQLKKDILLEKFYFDKFSELIISTIEYASITFIILTLIYFISYFKESIKSIKNILRGPTIDPNYELIIDQFIKKREDKVFFIKNKSTGEYEKFKLIKDLENFNFNDNNNNNIVLNEFSNIHASNSYEQSVLKFQSILKSEPSKNTEYEFNDSTTQSLVSSNNADIIRVKSLSMLSQIVSNNNVSDLIAQNATIMSNIESNEEFLNGKETEINNSLKRLNIRCVLQKTKCIFTCITQCLLYLKNEEFWTRYEKKSNTIRPNLQKYESQKDFRMKLRKITYKFWIKNLFKFLNYLKETTKECKFKNVEDLKLEMKKYLNDSYIGNNENSLEYTIPCILSTCLQINIIIIRSDRIMKLTPDILGKIEINNLSNIYLVQQKDSLYETAVENDNYKNMHHVVKHDVSDDAR